MNHRIPADVQIKRMQAAAKDKAMRTPEAEFTEDELTYLRLSYPDLYERVIKSKESK